MRLGYHTITWGGVVGDATGVTSIKDLYYRANGSMATAIRDISSVGYQGIEVFDGNLVEYQDRPDEFKGMMSDVGLELVSVYTGANFIYADILPDEMFRIHHAAELAAAFGADHLVVGGGARRAAGTSDEDYARLGESLDRVTDIAESFGLSATFHPHLSTIVESPDEVNKIMQLSRIGFCPDTAHLAAGGGSPAALIRAHGDRIRHVHLKDFRAEPFQFLPLGTGDLDFNDIMDAIKESGYDSWLMVELDSFDGDPRVAAEISKRFLDNLLSA